MKCPKCNGEMEEGQTKAKSGYTGLDIWGQGGMNFWGGFNKNTYGV